MSTRHDIDEGFTLTHHETYYLVSGNITGNAIRGTGKALRALAESILDTVPEPDPLEDAKFVTATQRYSGREFVLAKIDGVWYTTEDRSYPEDTLYTYFRDFKIIK